MAATRPLLSPRRRHSPSCALYLGIFVAVASPMVVYSTWTEGFLVGRGVRRAVSVRAGDVTMTSRPVAVLGANGRTGKLCVQELLAEGFPVKAITRTGSFGGDSSSPLLSTVKGDVTDKGSLKSVLKGCRSVIFAAAYSRNAGNKPSEVDNAGLVNVAEIARELGLERVVAVSSGAVTRPYAPVGLLLNVVGKGVLFEKKKGEESLRKILKGSGTTYTIIRPGGLKNTPALGPQKTELNQGDTIVGSVPRADVASAAVTAALAAKNVAAGTTFEIYSLDPANDIGPRPLMPWYNLPSGYETSGQTWDEAFSGLKKDERLSPRGFY